MAMTAGLEHFTSMLGSLMLSNENLIDEVHPSMRALFIWHAVEECEHKAVAFDLYKAVDGSYPRLMVLYLISSWMVVMVTSYYQFRLMLKDRSIFRVGSALKGLNWMFGFGKNAGHFRRMIPAYLDFFRPDFHPWQHDNSGDIAHWKAVLEDAVQAGQQLGA